MYERRMMDAQPSERILVFIVAYQAEKHLASVLERIPLAVRSDPGVEILVIDDGSSDAGVEVGRRWAEEHGASNVTILRNPVNQGYGGNQKLGYRIAIDGGFGFVILLHGDGQYAPELLPEFIRTWREKSADVVLGSRMRDLKSARAGGMPGYKLVGNRALTTFQNWLTGQQLSEYHTGYRGYSTRFLAQVPFEINTNDFHFDTEILLQAFHVRAKIEEFAIPTHYGSEICRVNGMKYAKDVIFSTVRFKMHQFGMLCDLKYRRLDASRYGEKTYMAYSSHAIALEQVRKHRPKQILDLGCGPGFVAQRCRELGAHVIGADVHPPLPGTVDEFRQINLESGLTPQDAFSFDMILLLDVIEHLADPEQFLVDLRNRSAMRSADQELPRLVLSTPNIAFAGIRLNLLLGRFSYAERGILDVTHKRLFTRSVLLRTLGECGYEVEQVLAASVPFQAVVGGRAGKMLGAVSGLLAWLWPSMFAFQFVVVCRPKPGVRELIRWSERHRIVSPVLGAALDPGSR
jgi:glycosyltransferase involved in cell wall biosynthesis